MKGWGSSKGTAYSRLSCGVRNSNPAVMEVSASRQENAMVTRGTPGLSGTLTPSSEQRCGPDDVKEFDLRFWMKEF